MSKHIRSSKTFLVQESVSTMGAPTHMEKRKVVSLKHLVRYREVVDDFLFRIVLVEETRAVSMEWKHPSSPVRKKFKTITSAARPRDLNCDCDQRGLKSRRKRGSSFLKSRWKRWTRAPEAKYQRVVMSAQQASRSQLPRLLLKQLDSRFHAYSSGN
ncbi:hypothetical protein TNCT_141331 [Trichonephila clavata]|uniref:Uncharacterized protein n=1 Tax=Trichonephila clavata TaxID=2740835 RepID=A0A8X6LAH9_TRICU|nr:hypothetical protein TNCT_141331 [Trichonephila clavata]